MTDDFDEAARLTEDKGLFPNRLSSSESWEKMQMIVHQAYSETHVAAAVRLIKNRIWIKLYETKEELPENAIDPDIVSVLQEKIEDEIDRAFAAVTDKQGGGRS